MDILQLKVFSDIAHEKSFVKAARLNYLTQPAISMQIKRLEEELNTTLFERTPRRVNLTNAGNRLLPEIEEILQRVGNLKHLAAAKSNVVAGELKIATIFSIGIYELAPHLKNFIKKYPQVHVNLHYRSSPSIYDLVLKNKMDVGFVAYPKERTGVHIIPFGTDRLVLATPAKHPLSAHKSVTLKKLEDYPFLGFDDGIPTGEEIKSILTKKKIKVRHHLTYENIDTLKKAIEVGLGVGLVPSKTITNEVKKGTLSAVEIKDAKLIRPLGILIQKRQVINPVIRHFLKTVVPAQDIELLLPTAIPDN